MASIFSLFGEVLIDNTNANKAIDTTTQKAEGSGSKVGKAFGTIAKGAVAVGTAVVGAASTLGGAAMKMAKDTSATADEIDKMSQKIGISRTAYQEWDYVLSQNGMDISKLQTGVKTLTAQMDSAKSGIGKSADAFKTLGVAVTNADGSLRSQEEVFNETVAALQSVENETERARLATQLFGKAGTEMAPLLNQSAESVEALKQKAHDLGMVMSDETVDAGVKFTDTMDTLKRSFGGIMNSLGGVVIPIIQKFADLIQARMPQIQAFIQRLTPILEKLFDNALPPLFSLCTTLLPILFDLFEALSPIFEEITTTVLPVIVDLIKSCLPLIGELVQKALPLAIELFKGLIPLIEAILPIAVQIAESVFPVFLQIAEALLPLFKKAIETILPPALQLVEAIAPILTTLAERALPIISALLEALMPCLEPIFGLLESLLKPLAELLEMILPPICEFISLLIDMLLPPLQAAFEGVANIVSGAFSAAFEALSGVFGSVKQVLGGIIDFIGGVFTGDWSRAWDGIVSIFKGIINLIPTILENVINGAIWIVNGLIDGINWALGWAGVDIEHVSNVQLPRLRIGMEYVPYDDFPALLHKGERVLTAGESEEYAEYEQQRKPTVAGKVENPDGSVTVIIQLGERSIVIENLNGKDPDELNDFIDDILEMIEDKIKRKGVVFG